ncbi:MAG: Crp/Fnr family transcriptional regulator [Candidatus Eisenbacteria bacterium]|nr:Crp/Fnr family transcriptional regulator [Candidatus Eisenbacteria bacterium]
MTDHRAERVHAALRSLAIFRSLSAEEHSRLETACSLRELRKGDALWNAGDKADVLFVLVSGRVKIVRHGSSGDVILELFGEGEAVGAVAVFNRMAYPASAFAMEPCSVLCMPAAEYFALVDRNPDLSRSLIRDLTRLNMSLSRKLEEMRGQKVEVRIAQFFLTLAQRMGRDTPEGTEIPIALTRQEIADTVGTTVETAIRTLSRWGREGVVVSGEGRFLVPSCDALRAIVDGTAEG